MVMSLFSVFWLSFGLLQVPTLGLAAAYSATGSAAEGAASKEYNAVVGLYLIVWGFALFTFFFFTLRTNIVFALIFLFVTVAAWILAGAYFHVGSGDYVMAGHLQKVSLLCLLFRSSLTEPGWRRIAVYCGYVRMVYDDRHHVRGDADGYQLPSGRFVKVLAVIRGDDERG